MPHNLLVQQPLSNIQSFLKRNGTFPWTSFATSAESRLSTCFSHFFFGKLIADQGFTVELAEWLGNFARSARCWMETGPPDRRRCCEKWTNFCGGNPSVIGATFLEWTNSGFLHQFVWNPPQELDAKILNRNIFWAFFDVFYYFYWKIEDSPGETRSDVIDMFWSILYFPTTDKHPPSKTYANCTYLLYADFFGPLAFDKALEIVHALLTDILQNFKLAIETVQQHQPLISAPFFQRNGAITVSSPLLQATRVRACKLNHYMHSCNYNSIWYENTAPRNIKA